MIICTLDIETVPLETEELSDVQKSEKQRKVQTLIDGKTVITEADAHNVSDAQYQSKLLRATLTYILTTDYNLTQKDLEFYITNKALYN
jgi:hypothetical protein